MVSEAVADIIFSLCCCLTQEMPLSLTFCSLLKDVFPPDDSVGGLDIVAKVLDLQCTYEEVSGNTVGLVTWELLQLLSVWILFG